jgi:hypothetical protein
MFKKLIKQGKNDRREEDEIAEEEVTYETVGMQEIKSFEDMTDDEILARADEIQARLNRVQEQEYQKAIQADQNERNQKAVVEADRQTRARRVNTYDEANKFLPKLEEIFGDSLPKPMKCALAVMLVKALPDDKGFANPANHKIVVALEDYFVEEAIRAQGK